MPVGNQPPNILLPSSVFTTLHGYGYDATNQTFLDGNSAAIFMFIEKSSTTSDVPEWNYGTATECGINPRGLIPQQTASIVLGGAYVSTNNTVSYAGHTYKFRLERDTNGNDVVRAVQIT